MYHCILKCLIAGIRKSDLLSSSNLKSGVYESKHMVEKVFLENLYLNVLSQIGTALGALSHVLKVELTRISFLLENLPSKSHFPKCSIAAMPLLGVGPNSSGTESRYICRLAISFISKVRSYNKEEVVALHCTCL